MLLCQGCYWIGKNTNKKFSCVIVLIMRPSSTLKFQFVFGFNECLLEIFSLFNFKTFGLIFGLWLYICDFRFYDTNDLRSHLTPCRWIKNLSAKTTKYILRNVEKNLWKGRVIVRVIKVHLLINICYSYICYMV